MGVDQDNQKIYDFEKRTAEFSKRIIRLCKELSRSSMNDRLIGQITGSAGSVGANYREANDALGDKDFVNRLKIARKEAKETIYWLELIEEANLEFGPRMQNLKQEAVEIKNILSSMIIKRTKKN